MGNDGSDIVTYLTLVTNKEELRQKYNQLASNYQQCKSVMFHAEKRSKEISNEMADIKAKLDSLGAFKKDGEE